MGLIERPQGGYLAGALVPRPQTALCRVLLACCRDEGLLLFEDVADCCSWQSSGCRHWVRPARRTALSPLIYRSLYPYAIHVPPLLMYNPVHPTKKDVQQNGSARQKLW